MDNGIKLISDVLERMLNILPSIGNCEEVINFKKWHKELVGHKNVITEHDDSHIIKIKELSEELKKKNVVIEELKTENANLYNKIDNLKLQSNFLVQDMNKKITMLEQDHDNKNIMIDELKSQNDQMHEDLAKQEDIIQAKNSSINKLESDNHDLKCDYNKLTVEKNAILENLKHKDAILENIQEDNKTLGNKINDLTSQSKRLEAELHDSHEEMIMMSNANKQLSQQLHEANNKQQALDLQIQELDRQLPQKDLLIDCQKLMKDMAQLPENLPDYYDTSSLVAFLAQCGQFDRLYRFWERCGTLIRETGTAIEGLGDRLDKLLEIHNLASGDSPARSLKPEINKQYDYNLEMRIASDGTTVREMLLPGLYNPGGELKLKALVILDK